MKKIIFVLAFTAITCSAKSQTMASGSTRDENSGTYSAIQHDNEFANTEINVEDRKITFSELPELKKAIWSIVTDPEGTVMTQKRITPSDNGMDLHRLPKGAMYFLTIIYKNKSQKAFVLHL